MSEAEHFPDHNPFNWEEMKEFSIDTEDTIPAITDDRDELQERYGQEFDLEKLTEG